MIKLENKDNLEVMSSYENNYFDLAIVDPPYGMVADTFTSTSKQFLNNGSKSAHLDNSKKAGFSLGNRPELKYWQELFRVSKNQIVFGMQYFVNFLPPHQCVVVWDKMNGKSRFSDAEIIYTSFDFGTRIIKQWSQPNGRIHPTQKPIELYEKILKMFAKEGMKIIDTHLGSGSSAIACDKFKCDFVGCEIDKKYFIDAKKRIDNHKLQLRMF